MARDFNGDTDEITCGSPSAADDLSTMTVIGWVYNDGGNTTLPRIFTKGGGSLGFDVHIWEIGGSMGRLRFQRPYSITTAEARTQDNAIQHNAWSFFGCCDGGAGVAPKAFYGDLTTLITEESSYVTQTTPAGTLTSDSGQTTRIGNDSIGGTTRGFSGSIEIVALFDTVLTEADMQQLQFAPWSVWASHPNCVHCFVVGDPDQDIARNLQTMTVSGTTIADGPSLLRFLNTPHSVPYAVAGASGGLVSRLAGESGLAGHGGLAGIHGGLAG